ncbi:hypothetical protein COU19_01780 [Candidatus Kaiserbacteria bacterium CG10_big_fil_rev_8_21_14_0_10_56_12]|uniref:DUF192 domain-containing protein n=1 Tax=Candidatus Kaiserbacteria bacterium CG10_big_fil_rev_8_21_14_0_10_56_12 TaxID=1974611 RepID=A0A2H0U9U0_9BACT|nr:MAG: hypothetical protein COU19_01780 [Candidatus Kaiserbacteria bacterium CG10_big_fil_rev_8_21_14_0_10_56_12]
MHSRLTHLLRYVAVAVLVGICVGALFFYKTHTVEAPRAGAQLENASFGGVSLRLEFATTTEARERGLAGRQYLPNDYGMLFIFKKLDRYGFWMKDTLVPLDIFWLDAQGRVLYVVQDVDPYTYPDVLYPPQPASYVLETAAGFARAHAIATGTPLHLQKFPTVSE